VELGETRGVAPPLRARLVHDGVHYLKPLLTYLESLHSDLPHLARDGYVCPSAGDSVHTIYHYNPVGIEVWEPEDVRRASYNVLKLTSRH